MAENLKKISRFCIFLLIIFGLSVTGILFQSLAGAEQSKSLGKMAQAAGNPQRPGFNHDSTSFSLLGAHRTLECTRCHSGGKYRGTPRTCDTCHNGQLSYGIPSGHMMTKQNCSMCHSENAWTPATFRHEGDVLAKPCSQCHNNQTATGKPGNHLVTTAQCDTCHKTTGWIPASFTHDASVAGQCSNCHNGQKATGKPSNHIMTTAQCDACHRTPAWIPAAFNHTLAQVMPGTCANCHGTTATGKPATHLATNLSCDQCHRTTAWIPASYANHNNPKLIGGHSGLDCRTCHSTTFSSAIYRDGTTYGSCANCHTRNYKYPGPGEHQVGPTLATSLAANATCSNCHRHSGYQY
ncbi:MAG: hypothetical protein HY036_10295 [Nitrospirae bacterium]|nr:hypothetical protein [Nitrospirota bacterium]